MPASIVATPTFDDARRPQTDTIRRLLWRADLTLLALDLRKPASRGLAFVLEAASAVPYGCTAIFLYEGGLLDAKEREAARASIQQLLQTYLPTVRVVSDPQVLARFIADALQCHRDRFERAASELVEIARNCRNVVHASARASLEAALARAEEAERTLDDTRRAKGRRTADVEIREVERLRTIDTMAQQVREQFEELASSDLEHAADPVVWARIDLPRAVERTARLGRDCTDKLRQMLATDVQLFGLKYDDIAATDPSTPGSHVTSNSADLRMFNTAEQQRQTFRFGTVALTIAGYLSFGLAAVAVGVAAATLGDMHVQRNIELTRERLRHEIRIVSVELGQRHSIFWQTLVDHAFAAIRVKIADSEPAAHSSRLQVSPEPVSLLVAAQVGIADRLELAAIQYHELRRMEDSQS